MVFLLVGMVHLDMVLDQDMVLVVEMVDVVVLNRVYLKVPL